MYEETRSRAQKIIGGGTLVKSRKLNHLLRKDRKGEGKLGKPNK